jgi:RNA polymerase I-specific transcription initiation factor RRN5
MERGTTVHSEGESASEGEHVVFNPADDSSSSYEAYSTSENERRKSPTIEKDPSTIKKTQEYPRSVENITSKTPTVTSKDLLRPSTSRETRTETFYSDEWIKKDAARWAANFTGPVDSENVSQDERPIKPRSHPFRYRSKKRKAEKVETRKHKAKRLKGLYNDSYRQLLNEEIRDSLLPTAEPHNRFPQSQIGVTRWTSIEKESFFTALSRLGKDNICGIASRIGSKSELEVQEYVHLLHQGMLEKALNEPRRQLLGFTDMPAAIQLSQECCYELEKAADALASRQNRYEEQKEQQKWGESWLLNSDTNFWVEEHLTDEGGSHDLREVLPAAELLNLRNWLELSTRVFMNPAAPRYEENWQFLAEPGEEPSIRFTAFADFHRLAISVTKRLVSTAIFCTMSRLRAMDPRSFNRYDIVKPADVEAAAKIIGLEINSDEFWRNCPRRCNLNIMKSTSAAAGNQSPMDYYEVEDILNKRRKNSQSAAPSDGEAGRPGLSAAGSPKPSSPGSSNSVSASIIEPESESEYEAEDLDVDTPGRDLAFEYMQGVELEYNGPIDPSGSEFEHPHSHKKRLKKSMIAKEALDRAHVEYTEVFDIQASLLEEQRLWEILKQEPPFAIKPEEVDLPKRPTQERKGEDELKDWREHMEFWSQWETLDQPVPTNAFSRPSARTFRQRASTRNAEVAASSSEATSETSGTSEEVEEMILDENISNDEHINEGEPGSPDNDSGTP